MALSESTLLLHEVSTLLENALAVVAGYPEVALEPTLDVIVEAGERVDYLAETLSAARAKAVELESLETLSVANAWQGGRLALLSELLTEHVTLLAAEADYHRHELDAAA